MYKRAAREAARAPAARVAAAAHGRARCRRVTDRSRAPSGRDRDGAAGELADAAHALGAGRLRRRSSPAIACCSIVEDDVTFATTLLEMARDVGLQGRGRDERRTRRSSSRARSSPTPITLDLRLPDIDGWVLLDRLKHDPRDASHPGAHRSPASTRSAAACSTARSASSRSRSRARTSRRASTSIREFVEKRVKQPARRRGRSGPEPGDHRADRRRRRRDHDGGVRRGRAAVARPRSPTTASCSTCACPGMSRLRADRADQGRPAAPPPAGHRLHRPRADRRGQGSACTASRRR